MRIPTLLDRRALLCQVAAGLSLTPLLVRIAVAGEPPLLNEGDPQARAVHYVEDASTAKDAPSGANCANCSLYGAKSDSDGTCTLFKERMVKAAGWCTAWSGL